MLKDLGPGVDSINLEGNNVRKLPDNLFSKASNLKYLHMSGNDISEIGQNTFNGAKNLKMVDLEGNPIKSLPDGLFKTNKWLEVVAINETPIENIPEGLFQNNTNLKEIHLYGNENLKELPDGLFENNKYLEQLEIWHNDLSSLPTSLKNAKGLKILRARNNRIKSIPEGYYFKSLKIADFEANEIDRVPIKLLEGLVESANENRISNNIDLKLKMNNLKEFPTDKLISLVENSKNKKSISYLSLNLNYLDENLSEQEKIKLKRLGVTFEDEVDVYYPQKGSIHASLLAENKKLKLNSELDVLELYYWDLGDSTYYGGEDVFKSVDQFKDYLDKKGRDHNDVSRDLDRSQAIVEILNKKMRKSWDVETKIYKNGKLIKEITNNRNVEGISQTFEDSSMKTGDNYKLVKSLYSFNFLNKRIKLAEFSVDAVAGNVEETPENNKEYTIPVRVNREGTEEDSIVNKGINHKASIVEKDGQYQVTLLFKGIKIGETVGKIGGLEILSNGYEQVATIQEIGGEYDQKVTFTLKDKVNKLNAKFMVPAMGDYAPTADIIFNWTEVPGEDVPTDNKEYDISVKSSKKGEDIPSVVNNIINHKASIVEKDGKYEVTLLFKEMNIGQKKGQINGLEILTDGYKQIANVKEVDGEYGQEVKFTLKDKVNKLTVKFSIAGMDGYNPEADIIFNWTGSSEENPVEDEKPSEKKFNVNYKFVSLIDRKLPIEVLELKPNQEIELKNNSIVNAKSLSKTIVRVYDGVWIFKGWDSLTKQINGTDVEFMGSWDFVKDDTSINNTDKDNNESTKKNHNNNYVWPVKKIEEVKNKPVENKNKEVKSTFKNVTINPELKTKGFIKGYVDNTFRPEKSMTRGEISSILSRVILENSNIKNEFKDLAADKWYSNDVEKLVGLGIINGYPDGTFRGEKSVTRAEFVTMLVKILDLKSGTKGFSDVTSDYWAKEAIEKCTSKGIVSGYPDGSFRGDKEITRAECVVMLNRAFGIENCTKKEIVKFNDLSTDHWAYKEIMAATIK
ncbi:MAG: S-layer homology domain-containing protein [Peptoniphilaceae bacterium]